MKLAEYLSNENLTLEAFGAMTNLSTATISRLARGLHRPNWDTMGVIEKATGGKVRPNDWADSPAEPAGDEAAA